MRAIKTHLTGSNGIENCFEYELNVLMKLIGSIILAVNTILILLLCNLIQYGISSLG